jgi:hypothetical protein
MYENIKFNLDMEPLFTVIRVYGIIEEGSILTVNIWNKL